MAAAAGGGVFSRAGIVLTGRLWAVPPPVSVDALTGLAVAALLIGLLCAWRGQDRLAWIGMLAAALIAGWLMAGAPRHLAALRGSWPIGLGVALAALLFVRALTDPTRLALAGLTLAAALHIAGTPSIWTQLALVPGLAALAMFALPATAGLVALPVAVDVAGLASLSVIAWGACHDLGSHRSMRPHCRRYWRSGSCHAPRSGCVGSAGRRRWWVPCWPA